MSYRETIHQAADYVKGRLEGKINNLANNIRSLMETLGLTKEKAMDALKVSEEDRKALASAL